MSIYAKIVSGKLYYEGCCKTPIKDREVTKGVGVIQCKSFEIFDK